MASMAENDTLFMIKTNVKQLTLKDRRYKNIAI